MVGFTEEDIERLLNERLEDRVGEMVQVTMKEDPDFPGRGRWVCAPQWIREVHDDHIVIAGPGGVRTKITLEYVWCIEFVTTHTMIFSGT